jgi:hypothetical protein
MTRPAKYALPHEREEALNVLKRAECSISFCQFNRGMQFKFGALSVPVEMSFRAWWETEGNLLVYDIWRAWMQGVIRELERNDDDATGKAAK